ncbi:hypothetical protein [Paenibacillus sp. RC21]|uniref:hypothetical protein n=1 Tax=Paenibacillus sp. RC21 TaxID=3156312 RepID=UPI0038371528
MEIILTKERFLKINNFLRSGLKTSVDKELFHCNSFEQLGRKIADMLYENVSGITLSDLREVTKILSKNLAEIEVDEGSFFIYFAKDVLGYKDLPKIKYTQCLREYIKLNNKFKEVIRIINSKVTNITSELERLTKERNAIVSRSNSDKSPMKNLKEYENQLTKSLFQSKLLFTEKEMLEFSKNTLIKDFGVLADKSQKELILKEIRQLALELASSNHLLSTLEMKFSYYYEVLENTKSNIDNYWEIFFKVKIYKTIMDAQRQAHSQTYKLDHEEVKTHFGKMMNEIPSPDELADLKFTNLNLYKTKLLDFIERTQAIDFIKIQTENSYCLNERRHLLLRTIEFYSNKEYQVFNNLMAVQMEGIFNDYLMDSTMTYRFTDLKMFEDAVLREKIDFLQNVNSGIYMEAILYFKYYYNHFVRNPIAHGSYNKVVESEDEEIFAFELILDLNFLLYMISRESESNKIIRFISGFYYFMKDSESRYRVLLNELNAGRIHAEFDRVFTPDTMQTVYWIVNPYFNPLYEYLGKTNEINEIRNDLCSKEFWEFVDRYLNSYDPDGINYVTIKDNFTSRVKGIIGYVKDHNPSAITALSSVHRKLKALRF